jgi:hypothetical protein
MKDGSNKFDEKTLRSLQTPITINLSFCIRAQKFSRIFQELILKLNACFLNIKVTFEGRALTWFCIIRRGKILLLLLLLSVIFRDVDF